MAARTAQLVTRALTRPQSATEARYTICSSCRHALLRQQAVSTPTHKTYISARSFSLTHASLKKSSASAKSNRKSPSIDKPDRSVHIPDNKHTRTIDAEPDPYDYTDLQAAIDTAIARLRDALTKTRDAGRISAEMIENLAVELNIKGSAAQGGSSHKEKAKVGDLASVVPKGGRMMQVYAAEESHIKPLITAIQSSNYSLAPQASDPDNPLLITIPVPPATTETRNQAIAEAKKVFDKAALEVRNARGDAQKKFRKMELGKIVNPDELRKAHKGMEDVVTKGHAEAKKVYDGAVKALQNV